MAYGTYHFETILYSVWITSSPFIMNHTHDFVDTCVPFCSICYRYFISTHIFRRKDVLFLERPKMLHENLVGKTSCWIRRCNYSLPKLEKKNKTDRFDNCNLIFDFWLKVNHEQPELSEYFIVDVYCAYWHDLGFCACVKKYHTCPKMT